MGAKSRGNWNVNFCLKECANRNIKCSDCIKFDNFEPIKEDED